MVRFARIPGCGGDLLPRLRWWAAGAAALLLGAAAVTAVVVPPQYRVRLNGNAVGVSRNLNEIETSLRAEWDRQLRREVRLTTEGGAWTYRLSDLGLNAAPDQTVEALREQAAALPWWQRLAWQRPVLQVNQEPTWDLARLQAAVAPIKEAVTRPAVPAKLQIVDQEPVITPEVVGATLTAEAVQKALASLGDQSELQVPVEAVVPDVTKASLMGLGIKRKIAEWSTRYAPNNPRAENVERAARAFNGLILKPGEVISYNSTVGPVDNGTGWKEAYVIENGQLVPGIGGGICQVATTLYGAALRANLEVVERHQHQLAVSYIDPSQDAAVAEGWEDLKLRNTSLGHLYVESVAGGGTVTFRLYGDVPQGQEVKVESQVIGSRPFETKRVVDQSLSPGEQMVTMNGNKGYVSQAYRSVFINGELVSRELLSKDNYLPTTQVMKVGPSALAR